MIERTNSEHAPNQWLIEGWEISLPYRRSIPESKTLSQILAYRDILTEKTYTADNACLCEMFRFFGGIGFVKIGMAFKAVFLDCYAYFAAQFVKKWAKGSHCLHSKVIGHACVFGCMLDCPENPIRYDFRYILSETPNSTVLFDLTEEAFADYWTPNIEGLMSRTESLASIAKRVGAVRLTRYMMRISQQTEAYLRRLAAAYTENRELISLRKLYADVFGDDSRSTFAGGDTRLFQMIQSVVDEETAIQNRRFPAENRRAMEISSDEWVLYVRHGVSLHYMRLDFTEIRQTSLRTEVKFFLKNRFSGAIRTTDRVYTLVAYAAGILCRNNPRIHFFSEVDDTDVRMLRQTMESEDRQPQAYIMAVFSACKAVFRYLCGGERDDSLRTPKPGSNPFQGITFVNASQYSRNTPYMPANVAEGLTAHANELSDTDALVLRIFNETGMRAKEVAFLEEGGLEKTRSGSHALLRFVPYKILKARRKAGVGDYHRVQISLELAELIEAQARRTESLRRQYGLPYLFLHQNEGYRVSMLDVSYFIVKINKLIQKHHLSDEGGQLWHFTSRQCRKTLVVNMIENGAAIEEIVYQLGHLDRSTAAKYYAEVRTVRLAELNSEFFRKQFDLLLSGEQLAEYTEEERRLLYVDFRLGYRRVEMGFCTKKLCGGACGRGNRMHHCANCKNLCTGKQYLSHWELLLEAQEHTVVSLVEAYLADGVTDYSEFAEYRRECTLLEAYRNVAQKIRKSEATC